ncbi:MAG TPA: methyltransferase domain-containing protein [Thermoleophilia bacterium]|nr:methyltransferase domain-containing protein [Thermoleophilia bacterium]
MTDDVWREFFDSFAPQYMNEVFTGDSVREAAFLVELLGLSEGATILDIGCGTGRHAVELARAGYAVTGIDISAGMLREARAAAEQARVGVELIEADATSFDLGRVFDAAVCLCEGSLGLVGGDDAYTHDAAVLGRAFAALRPGAPFALTLLNGLRMIRDATPDQVERGAFDPATLTETFEMDWEADGRPRSMSIRQRGYVPSELVLLCRAAGFTVEHIWGGTAGDWGRRPVELDEMEIMAVLRRPPA